MRCEIPFIHADIAQYAYLMKTYDAENTLISKRVYADIEMFRPAVVILYQKGIESHVGRG